MEYEMLQAIDQAKVDHMKTQENDLVDLKLIAAKIDNLFELIRGNHQWIDGRLNAQRDLLVSLDNKDSQEGFESLHMRIVSLEQKEFADSELLKRVVFLEWQMKQLIENKGA